jgi:hypothetical protein
MIEREGESLAATVLGDKPAVVMKPLAEDDQVALLAILRTGAAEVPVSCPIMCVLATQVGCTVPLSAVSV